MALNHCDRDESPGIRPFQRGYAARRHTHVSVTRLVKRCFHSRRQTRRNSIHSRRQTERPKSLSLKPRSDGWLSPPWQQKSVLLQAFKRTPHQWLRSDRSSTVSSLGPVRRPARSLLMHFLRQPAHPRAVRRLSRRAPHQSLTLEIVAMMASVLRPWPGGAASRQQRSVPKWADHTNAASSKRRRAWRRWAVVGRWG